MLAYFPIDSKRFSRDGFLNLHPPMEAEEGVSLPSVEKVRCKTNERASLGASVTINERSKVYGDSCPEKTFS